MKENSVDTIVLGCTHYPLVGELISEIMPREVNLIDTGIAIAKRVLKLSLEKGHTNDGKFNIHIESTGDMDEKSVEFIFAKKMKIKYINF